jgi:hypothetical protein
MSPCRVRRLSITAMVLSLLRVAACSGRARTAGTTDRETTPSPAKASLPAPRDINAAGAKRLPDLGGADWLALAAGSAWVAGLGDGSNEVRRLDGRTGKLRGSVRVPGQVCMSMDVGFGSVWAASCGPPVVTRINPKAASVQASIAVDVGSLHNESSVAAGEGGVWVLTSVVKTQLVKIDPTATRSQAVGSGGVAADDSAAWLSAHDEQTVWRLPLP